MKRRIIIGIFLISVFFTGCSQMESETMESVGTAKPTESMKPVTTLGNDVVDIMNALRFWINKTAWEYGTRVYTAYLDDDISVCLLLKESMDLHLSLKK